MNINSKRGFSALEAIIILFIVLVLSGAGYYVWHKNRNNTTNTSSTALNSRATNTPVVKSFTECVEAGGDINQNADATSAICAFSGKQYAEAAGGYKNIANWDLVSQSQVTLGHTLGQFKLSLTLPDSTVNNLMYRYDWDDGGTYEFAPKNLVTNQKCYAYIVQQKGPATQAGIQLNQNALSTSADGLVPGLHDDKFTLLQYYNKYKAASSNYVADPATAHKFYKVGDWFYSVSLTQGPVFQGSAFKKACPGVSGMFEQQLADALSTLKQVN